MADPLLDMVAPELEMKSQLHVIIAGLPKSGKSTSLNNIFDLNLPAELSATQVTDEIVSINIEQNGISLTVTDTPGFTNPSKKVPILQTLKAGKNTSLFLLTLRVSSSSCINYDYRNILKNVTEVLGHKIWDWSLVLLTFSDDARESEFHSDQKEKHYQEYLTQHCVELQKALAYIGVKKNINPFFEYTSADQFENQSLDGIVAIPVGKVPNISTKRLFPLQSWSHEYNWTDLVYMEVVKINREVQHREESEKNRKIQEINQQRLALIQFKYSCCKVKDILDAGKSAGIEGAAVGTVIGEVALVGVGAVLAYALGGNMSTGIGLGKLLGKPVGAAAGALIVGGTAATVVAIKYLIDQKKIKQMERKCRDRELQKCS